VLKAQAATRQAFRYELFRYWEFYSEGADKVIDSNVGPFISVC
jgi:hypothetical protein